MQDKTFAPGELILQPVKLTWIENMTEIRGFLRTKVIIMNTEIKIKATVRGILQRIRGDYKRDWCHWGGFHYYSYAESLNL